MAVTVVVLLLAVLVAVAVAPNWNLPETLANPPEPPVAAPVPPKTDPLDSVVVLESPEGFATASKLNEGVGAAAGVAVVSALLASAVGTASVDPLAAAGAAAGAANWKAALVVAFEASVLAGAPNWNTGLGVLDASALAAAGAPNWKVGLLAVLLLGAPNLKPPKSLVLMEVEVAGAAAAATGGAPPGRSA